jgi:nicotinamidase-related amidase
MTPEPLSRAAAVFLLVDHQTGVFERVVKAPPRYAVELNVRRLARAAAILDVPVIFTTSEEDGTNGALLPSLEEILPAAYASRIDRHGIIDSLADQVVAKAVSATGRRQLITAGIGTEVDT